MLPHAAPIDELMIAVAESIFLDTSLIEVTGDVTKDLNFNTDRAK